MSDPVPPVQGRSLPRYSEEKTIWLAFMMIVTGGLIVFWLIVLSGFALSWLSGACR